MATFNYEISPYKKNDGTFLIKIRMIHNRKVVRKPSDIYVTKEQLSRDLSKIKDSRVLDSVNRHLDTLRREFASMDRAKYMDASALWDAIQARIEESNGFRLDFVGYATAKMERMERKTAEGYRSSIHALQRYIGKESIDVNDITYTFLVGFRDWLERENGKGCRAASYYLSCLRHIHNLARDEYNDDDVGLVRIPRQPFKKGLIPPQPTTAHRSMTASQIRAVASYIPCSARAAMAKDVFLLSFYLVGINTVDLFNLQKNSLENGVFTYSRAKTDSVRSDNAVMSVRVEKEASEIMARHVGNKNLLDFADRYSNHRNFNQNVNKGLREIGEAIGVDGLTSYYARHTWATIARNECKIDFETVHEALNHAKRGADRITDIYVKRDFSAVWEANRKVIDHVFGHSDKV